MTPNALPHVTLVGAYGRDAEIALHAAGMRVTHAALAELQSLATPLARAPQLVMVDLRGGGTLPPAIAAIRRAHPDCPVVLLTQVLEPALMLEAMRAGVTEIVPEPMTQAAMEAAVGRVWATGDTPDAGGLVLAVVGAKGGIGATTIATNMATVLERHAPGQALVVDLHVSQGDAALLLGVEPRFSIVDALENTHRLDEAYFRSLVVSGPKGPALLASSDRHIVGSPAADRVRAVVDYARRLYKYVVLDIPRSDLNTMDGLDSAQKILVVVNQELSSIRNAARLVEALTQRYGKDRVALVLARYDKGAEINTPDIEKVVGLPVAYVVPNDYRSAVKAANQGVPMAADSQTKVAGAIKTMAYDAAGIETTAPAGDPQGGSLFGRLRRIPAVF